MAIRIAVLLGLLGVPAQDPKPEIVDAGALKCEIHISRTAHLFHVVDQLAEWSPFCHKQYGRHFGGKDGLGITEADRGMLARHTSVRVERGWGGGLEQTFYSPLDLEGAIKAGLDAGHLTAEQASIEREVFA
ncbi:MAG TPA: hypothetical protein VGK61_00995, partial [Planctomycetota bacterium]